MKKERKEFFDSVLAAIKPSRQELEKIAELTKELKQKLEAGLKKHRIKAYVFIGGSLAKNTIIRKDRYDIDIFIRFPCKEYSDRNYALSDILEKALQGMKYKRIHGSRDYFHVQISKANMPILFEIVPVLAIKKPQEARNVTDLSFFHVNYVSKHINEKIADEIRIAKAFCYAQNCYGAESHIQGFSGYAIEVLVLHFKSFMSFVRTAAKWQGMLKRGEKIVIDPAKHYKNADEVLLQINEAKLVSPIVLVDPTYAARNVTASVSADTLTRFIQACKAFIAKPNIKFFEKKEIDAEELKKIARRKKALLAVLIAETKKADENVAAAKLRRFFDFVVFLMEKNSFGILQKEIEFKKKEATFYILYKKPSAGLIVAGPPINLVENLINFKKKYKKVFVKNGKAFAKTERKIKDIKDVENFVKKSSEMRDMEISKFKLIK